MIVYENYIKLRRETRRNEKRLSATPKNTKLIIAMLSREKRLLKSNKD